MNDIREIRHGHLFCGLGGGAKGFNAGEARVGNLVGRFRCIGGIDIDPAAIRDFDRLAGARGTVLDLFDRDQYRAFHGSEPAADWHEATPADIVRAMGGERPHIWFLSAPCKGFSGLLAENKSKTDKYQALNRLTLRGIWLALEAYKDDPVELIVFENVPRIANRGRHLLDQIVGLLQSYGYATAETTHDCGELGELAQSRKRFLLVARHVEKVPPFLYEPAKRPLRAVGDVLQRMPMPGDPAGGPMHRVPNLQWKTWVRLAFVEAGSDWRSLNRLAVKNGLLRDYLIAPHATIDDPRFAANGNEYGQYGVCSWDEPMGAVINVKSPGQGMFAVQDPRHGGPDKHSNEFHIIPWQQQARAVTSAHGSGQCVADPRSSSGFGGKGKYIVTPYDAASNTVIAGSTTGNGAFAVADPRPHNWRTGKREAYDGGGHYGVIDWREPCGAVSSAANIDNGRWSVADPRLPDAAAKLVAVIRSLDGTWHRPFTTLELAALQSLLEPEEHFELDGLSDSAWRERIGNAVPPKAAQAIAGVMGTTLLLAWSGETFLLSSQPVWVRPVAIGLSVAPSPF